MIFAAYLPQIGFWDAPALPLWGQNSGVYLMSGIIIAIYVENTVLLGRPQWESFAV